MINVATFQVKYVVGFIVLERHQLSWPFIKLPNLIQLQTTQEFKELYYNPNTIISKDNISFKYYEPVIKMSSPKYHFQSMKS